MSYVYSVLNNNLDALKERNSPNFTVETENMYSVTGRISNQYLNRPTRRYAKHYDEKGTFIRLDKSTRVYEDKWFRINAGGDRNVSR